MFKTGFALKKHSPAIFTGVGIVGLGVTAVLAYKSRNKVEAVVEKIEEARENGEEVNKLEVAKGLADALYKPVLAGAASVTCILLAQKIQNNRIKTLLGVVAVEQARNIYFEKKYRKQHGDEEYNKFITPTDEIEHVEIDKKGKEKITVETVKAEVDKSIGQWYSDSSEYTSDDHQYNKLFIGDVNEKMKLLLFQRGTLLLNEVLDALGFERIRNGALLGWTTMDNFEIEMLIQDIGDESVETKEQIWVTWTTPRYVYNEIDLNGGRYSPFSR